MEQESEEEKIQAVLPCPEKQEATELKECWLLASLCLEIINLKKKEKKEKEK